MVPFLRNRSAATTIQRRDHQNRPFLRTRLSNILEKNKPTGEETKIINTFNETHLHRTLKTIYSLEHPGCETEKKTGSYIADILTAEGDVIEIQTGSLGHLKKKAQDIIASGHKITVVYPLPAVKYIETKKLDGTVSRRKSPSSKNLYSVFRELTALCPILLDRHFTLEILEVVMTETRDETENAVQSRNGRRRFKKNWTKTGKRLEEIRGKHVLNGKRSYLKLIPENLEKEFLFRDFHAALKGREKKISPQDAHLMLWCYCRMGIIRDNGKVGRFNKYLMD